LLDSIFGLQSRSRYTFGRHEQKVRRGSLEPHGMAWLHVLPQAPPCRRSFDIFEEKRAREIANKDRDIDRVGGSRRRASALGY